MKRISDDHKSFLRHHNIPIEKVLDVSGMSRSEYIPIMERQGKIFVVNATPCQLMGHTIRTKAGHCAQCNTASIAFQKRSDSSGFVYIAGTKIGSLIKIGCTESYIDRQKSLRDTKYAGFKDWRVLFVIHCAGIGNIEQKLHKSFRGFSVKLNYLHDNKLQRASEVYSLGFTKARNVLIELLERNNIYYEKAKDYRKLDYDF